MGLMPSSGSNSDSEPLKVGVIGCGRMGKLHVRVYSEMPQVKVVGIHDADPDTCAAISGHFGTRAERK